MKLGIMQPYFFPYIGYFQLMNLVDEFIIYDNIEYTKKGWINRNRILSNGVDEYISLPLKKDSDYLNVNERFLADSWDTHKIKLLNKIKESYKKAPYFDSTFTLVEKIIKYEEPNLFKFLYHSLNQLSNHLNIDSKLTISSSIQIDHNLKSQNKVLEICKKKNISNYINPIGGINLYQKEVFNKENIHLKFIETNNIEYPQFNNEFLPNLSIIDILMFNSDEKITDFLNYYYLIR
jgi:WbqC-like protein